jgi:hypothetical protein
VDFIRGKHKIIGDLLFGQTDVPCHPTIAHVFGRMAAKAIIDESSRAPLQGGFITKIDFYIIERIVG